MPRREDLENFNRTLISIGNEPSVLADRGEEIEDVEPPEQGVPADLSALLGDIEADADEQLDGSRGDDFDGEAIDDEGIDLGEFEGEAGPSAFESSAAGDDESREAADEIETTDDLFADEPVSDADSSAFDDLDFPEDDLLADTEEPDAVPDDDQLGAEAEDFLSEFAASLENPDEPEVPDALEEPDFGDAQPFDEPEPLTDEDALPDEDIDAADDLGAAETAEAETANEPDAFSDFDMPSDMEGFSFDDSEDTFGDEPLEVTDEDIAEAAFEAPETGEEPVGEEFAELADDEPDETAVASQAAAAAAMESDDEDAVDVEDVLDVDEFSLGDFGAEFGLVESAAAQDVEDVEDEGEDDLNPADRLPDAMPAGGDARSALQLSATEFAHLKTTLGALPLNLKIAVEQTIVDEGTEREDAERLIRLLVGGASPRVIADAASKITGQQIRIPRGYEKKTGIAFEQEKGTIGYLFRETILPILRVAAVVSVVLGILLFTAYNFAYRPLQARALWARGLEVIDDGAFVDGNAFFDRAWRIWTARPVLPFAPMKAWFLRYADAFTGNRRYSLAVEKYDQLIFSMDPETRTRQRAILASGEFIVEPRAVRPVRDAILRYADLESSRLANFEKARNLLAMLTDVDFFDYDARIALGDNYIRWADEDPSRFEDARVQYARLIDRYGETDELLFKMLRYFIRTDDPAEVHRLKTLFQSDPRIAVDPDVYAELGGYLITRDELDEVRAILFRALDRDDTIPETHYHLARFFRRTGAPADEIRALNNAAVFFEFAEPLSRRRLPMMIDTEIRTAEYYAEREEYLTAESRFVSAIDRYESAVRAGMMQRSPVFARSYAGLGDILYYVGREFDAALARYDTAVQHGFSNPELEYRRGFVHYRRGRYDEALMRFFDAADGAAPNRNLLFSTANAFARNENDVAAAGYYRELTEMLRDARARVPVLFLDEDPAQRALIEYVVKAHNNLGVAQYRLYRRGSDPDRFSQAVVNLQIASETAENFGRDFDTAERTATRSIAYLNLRGALYPESGFEPQIYAEIPEDFSDMFF